MNFYIDSIMNLVNWQRLHLRFSPVPPLFRRKNSLFVNFVFDPNIVQIPYDYNT